MLWRRPGSNLGSAGSYCLFVQPSHSPRVSLENIVSIQICIILAYIALTVVIGVFTKKKNKSSSAFHGTGLGVLMCVTAGTGEWLGGTSTTGVSEYGYLFGLSGAWYTMANAIGVMILAVLFAKLYRSLDTVTVPGIIEKYIGVDARVVASILLTFVMVAVGTSQIIAAGTLGVSVFGMDYATAVIVLGAGFIVYTLMGGMTAVAYTNTMHLVCMYGGIVLALVLVLPGIGGLAGMRTGLPDAYFSLAGIGGSKISGWIMASVLGACTAQAGIQPILAARDTRVARKAAIITAFIVAPFGILTALLGMAAKVIYPDLENAKQALPMLMMTLNPVAGGIVISSIIAAVLSTVSPIILACGTMVAKDIYLRKLRPAASDGQILFMSRLVTALAGVMCIVISIVLYDSSRILDIVYFAYSLRGSLFVMLLFGIYWKGMTQKGAVNAMIITAVVGFFWVAYKAVAGRFPIHPAFNETYVSVLSALVFSVLFSVIGSDRKDEAMAKEGKRAG